MDEVQLKIAKLETTVEERWNAHDKQSKLIWKEIKEDINAFSVKLDNMINTQEGRKTGCMKEVNKKIGFAIGIPVTIGAILTVAIIVARLLIP